MSKVEPLAPVRIAGQDVHFAQGVKAGGWVFLTGHEATDFATGLAPEVAGKPHFPLYGQPKHRREGDFILRRFTDLLGAAGTDLEHSVRLDQYYPTWKAVDPYHHARRAHFGENIPPSTSILMEELMVTGADISASIIAVVPSAGREVKRVRPDTVRAPTWSGFAPVMTSGDYVFVAGQMANAEDWSVDARAHVADGALWAGFEIRLQAEFIINERIKPALEAAGSSLEGVVKAQAYLSNVEDFPHFIEVWNAHFGERGCALSVVPASGFAMVEGIIEINVMALADGGTTRKEIVDCAMPATMAYGAPAVRAGDLLLLSALMAVDEDGAAPAAEARAGLPHFAISPRAQMRLILEQAERICRAGGTALENVVRVHQFHADLAEFYPMHAVWRELLPDQPIPFSAVRVPAPLPAPGATVMLDLWVYAP